MLVFIIGRGTREEAEVSEDTRPGESLAVDEVGVTGFVDNEAVEQCFV